MSNKIILKQLNDYQRKVKKWYKIMKGNNYNKEQNTTVKFVIPLLKILGWNPLSKDMEFEYTVHDKNRKHPIRVDIALYINNSNKPKIFVEVKCLQDELGTGRYLLRYLHAKKIDYGIYTNGKELKLIDKYSRYNPEGLFTIRAEHFIKYNKALLVLSKKSVKDGKLDKLAKTYHGEKFWNWIKKYEKNTTKYDLRLRHAQF